jgi:mannose-6-phosphate isomerase-like protein (cupin superfamily)
MIQLNDPQPERLYEQAESLYYVLGGDGTLRMNGRDLVLATGHFAMIPRGTVHSFTRRGRRPLILLAMLSGEPCETSTAP